MRPQKCFMHFIVIIGWSSSFLAHGTWTVALVRCCVSLVAWRPRRAAESQVAMLRVREAAKERFIAQLGPMLRFSGCSARREAMCLLDLFRFLLLRTSPVLVP